jgi:putative transposase
MSQQVSPGTHRRYPLTLVCAVLRVAGPSVYASADAEQHGRAGTTPGPCGPQPDVADSALLARIRAVIAASPFHGEGYRKIWARLRHGEQPLQVSKRRVLRLLRSSRPSSSSTTSSG